MDSGNFFYSSDLQLPILEAGLNASLKKDETPLMLKLCQKQSPAVNHDVECDCIYAVKQLIHIKLGSLLSRNLSQGGDRGALDKLVVELLCKASFLRLIFTKSNIIFNICTWLRSQKPKY